MGSTSQVGFFNHALIQRLFRSVLMSSRNKVFPDVLIILFYLFVFLLWHFPPHQFLWPFLINYLMRMTSINLFLKLVVLLNDFHHFLLLLGSFYFIHVLYLLVMLSLILINFFPVYRLILSSVMFKEISSIFQFSFIILPILLLLNFMKSFVVFILFIISWNLISFLLIIFLLSLSFISSYLRVSSWASQCWFLLLF